MTARKLFAWTIGAGALVWCLVASPAQAQQPAQPPTGPPSTPPAIGAPAQPAATAPVPLPPPVRPLDVVVTVTMVAGKAETFAREIDRMEIIALPDGRIDMVHLVLVAGGERNTHVWYNFSRVAKLSYRFVTADGKKKVNVRVIKPYLAEREITERLQPLDPSDYR